MLDQLEITVQHKTALGWPVTLELTAADQFPRRTKTMIPNGDDPMGTLLPIAAPKKYAIALGKMLFNDVASRQLFAEALALPAAHVHVLLVVEDEALQTIKWELLAAPSGDQWILLTRYQRTPFSRYLPGASNRHYPPVSRDEQRALVIWANPPEGGRFARFEGVTPDGQDPYHELRRAMGPIETDVLGVDIDDAIGPPTLAQLVHQLTVRKYTLLHIVAHGEFSRSKRAPIVFLRDNQTPSKLKGYSAEEISAELSNVTHLPYLIFMTACQAALRDSTNPFGNVANVLMSNLGIPAVIAMSDTVSIATANELAFAFYPYLLENPFVDIALTRARAGIARLDVAIPALYSRLGHRPLFVESSKQPLSDADWLTHVGRAIELFKQRAPKLVAELQAARKTIESVAMMQPDERKRPDLIQDGQARHQVETLVDRVLEMPFEQFARNRPVPPQPVTCPFKAAQPFTYKDRDYFFGRDKKIKAILDKFKQTRFVAVVGPSGSGKTSLLQAALAPRLPPQTTVIRLASNAVETVQQTLASMSSDQLLVIDQFEKLFEQGTREQLTSLVEQLLNPTSPNLLVLQRNDSLPAARGHSLLLRALEAGRIDLPLLTGDTLRDVVERQAAAVNLHFEAGLAQTIVNDVGEEPAAQSIAQQLLADLWGERQGRWLPAGAYHKDKGTAEATIKLANKSVAGLSEAQLKQVGDLCTRFLRFSQADSSAPPTVTSLERSAIAGSVEPEIWERLINGRLLNSDLQTKRTPRISLTHQLLVRRWDHFKRWLAEDRPFIQTRNLLAEDAQRWTKNGASDLLLRGDSLQVAHSLLLQHRLRLGSTEISFIEASLAEAERTRVRERLSARSRGAIRGSIISAIFYGMAALTLLFGMLLADPAIAIFGLIVYTLLGGAAGFFFHYAVDPTLLQRPYRQLESWLRLLTASVIPLALLKGLEQLFFSAGVQGLELIPMFFRGFVTGAVWGGLLGVALFTIGRSIYRWMLFIPIVMVGGGLLAVGIQYGELDLIFIVRLAVGSMMSLGILAGARRAVP